LAVVPLFVAVAVVSLRNFPRVRKWIAVEGAGLKASTVGGLGIAACIASTRPENNVDANLSRATVAW